MDEEEEEEFTASIDGVVDRDLAVRRMTDQQLLHYYDRLHHPDLVDDVWIPILEVEIRRRGLRSPS